MKVYVDKNDVDVLEDLFEATNSYECWACNRDDNLEIVFLADYTKQVRKEVCEEIREYLKNHKYKVIGDYNKQTLQYDETYICELFEINKFLDQLQGEKNE